MLVVLNRVDGLVSIMSLCPVKAVVNITKGQKLMDVLGCRGGKIFLRNTDESVLELNLPNGMSFGDIETDSIPGVSFQFPNLEEEIAKWSTGSNLVCASYHLVKRDDIPVEQTFFNSWKWTGKIEHDMPLARNIKRAQLRLARTPLLDALDAKYMRADENGDQAEKDAIIAQKTVLRNITALPAIEEAQTVEQLIAIKLVV